MRFCSENIARTALLITASTLAALGENTTSTLTGPSQTAHAVSVVRTDPRTGRLVRRIVVSPPPGAPAGSKPSTDPTVLAVIDDTAQKLEVSPELVHSVIEVESNYNPYAISPKGAEGLMQLMPATARRFGVTNPFDPRQNIEAGVRYLKFLKETFQDDRLAIAAYNAGEKAVARYGGVPPYPETVDYVAKVGQKYTQAKKSAETRKIESKAAEQPAPKPAEDETRHVIAYLDTEGRLHIATR
ncbi:MAG TPA: lytic transglycosylase domain-containing protein [Bryobacteraceae bacterium]|nr:lytic transglycosylase domain-containing protein [Bryobacteraceae bacterium]